jgi:hypothetical protein
MRPNQSARIGRLIVRKIIPLLTFAIAVAALSGCSTGGLPGGSAAGGSNPPAAASSGSGSGSGATASNACGVAHDALAKVVTAALSAPFEKDNVCYFGVGSNASQSGSALAQLYGDSVFVGYSTSDVDSQYQAAAAAYSGSKKLSGVGTQAQYYDGGNGNPQVVARTSRALCTVQTNFNDATEVGLSKPTDSRTIATADVPKLAGELGGVCTALFGG